MSDLPREVLLEAGLILDERFRSEDKPNKPKWLQTWKPRRYAQPAHAKDLLRHHVFLRDRSKCESCELLCNDLHTALNYVRLSIENHRLGFDFHFSDFKRAIGLEKCWRFPKSLWDADMILPARDGGMETLSNMRTLCLLCHRKETNKLIYRKDS